MTAIKAAYVLTHPIQYFVPLLRRLARSEGIELAVIYATDAGAAGYRDPDFGRTVTWGGELLEGYRSLVLCPGAPIKKGFLGVPGGGLVRLLTKDRADVIITHGWGKKLYLEATAIGLARGIPVLYRTEAVEFYDPGVYRSYNIIQYKMRRLRPAALRLLFSRIAGFVVAGKLNREYYSRLGVPADRLYFAPYSIDSSRFGETAAPVEARRARAEQLGLAPAGLRVIFAGKLTPRKRPGDVIAAVARMASRERVEVLFVGAGELQPELEMMAREKRVRAVFAGFCSQRDLPLLYSLSDVLVLPSELDTWGLVVNEAMSMGLPAVISDRVGCGPDLVTPGETGYICPVGDVAALARALETMASDPALLSRMRERARERIAGYGIDETLKGYLEAIRAVAGSGSRPSNGTV